MKQISTLLMCWLLYATTSAQSPNRFDIVIDELMADPTPAIGLPGNEWIELKNVSSATINLSGWRIGDASGQSGPLPVYNLKPDSFVIVCTASAVSTMQAFGSTIAVTSFPTLNNGGDLIYLKSPQNKIIHAVNYSDSWYANELKKEGGWTLEMIDTHNPCTGAANWKASTDSKGGTPGKKNAVDAENKDAAGPSLLKAFAPDSVTLVLVFDEPLDSLKAAAPSSYSISDGIGSPQTVVVTAPVFDHAQLKLAQPLLPDHIYTITVSALTDCAGNLVSEKNSVRTGLSREADSMDIVVNEILFNPRSAGTDYVEFYNRSKKIIDSKNLFIANRNTAGSISSISQLSAESRLLFPGDFLLVSEDAGIVKREYITLNPDAFITISSMPSYNDDEGDVIILNGQGKIVDELRYNEKWHFPLIENPEGVSLERINYDAPTQNADNWHSAASSVGYGTPGYKNSQYGADASVKGMITVSPEIISPDSDGQDDYATIQYHFPGQGYVANITVFDDAGRVVRYLQQNALCGTNGSFRWDGLGEKAQALPAGIYIIYTQVFNAEGRKKQFKNVIVLARKR